MDVGWNIEATLAGIGASMAESRQMPDVPFVGLRGPGVMFRAVVGAAENNASNDDEAHNRTRQHANEGRK
jgi:hypothetical protein